MKRRTFLQMSIPLAAAALAVPGCKRIEGSIEKPVLPLVLRGGRVFMNGRWQTTDVGIDDAGRLRFAGDLRGTETLNVSGRVVSPGFIDILADNSHSPETTYQIFEKYKVADGVTTALQMHGGSVDCGSYYRRFSRLPHVINFGVSTFVMGIRARSGGLRQVEKNLEEGALGVSHSLEYQPAPYAEMLAYAKLAKKYERPLFLHLRYSSREKELDGVDEAIRLARDSGARVHIDHLHSTGGTFHMEQALEKIRTANAHGMTITTCIYPYSYWATYLSNNRFGAGWQQRYGLTYGDLRIVGSSERLTARTFAHYRKTSALAAVPEGTMPLDKTVDLALREDFCMIGSDGGIQFEPRANSHPRGAGCFATAIRHGLDIGMPLEKILEKMTSLPRSVVQPALQQRGIMEEGATADLTVFDPTTIRGNATVENPNQFSSGIDLVIVGGKIAFKDGRLAARNGVAIKNS
ncbi:MAG TPA: amidohydrolase family protein [Pyrinomonadaceae bacterium]|nr:amidohydrolase family protein [Pyrinomonadaceae bacterium]